MDDERWPGATAEALAAAITNSEAERARQLQDLLDRAERGQDTGEVLVALGLIEENLASLRSQQVYRRIRGDAR